MELTVLCEFAAERTERLHAGDHDRIKMRVHSEPLAVGLEVLQVPYTFDLGEKPWTGLAQLAVQSSNRVSPPRSLNLSAKALAKLNSPHAASSSGFTPDILT